MVYGVDQCRRCGKPIRVADGAWQRHEESLAKKPMMTPREWKAAGWKASPTWLQTIKIFDGVCYDCKPAVLARRKPTWRVKVGMTAFIILALGTFLVVAAQAF